MAKRHRYATRDELHALVAGRVPQVDGEALWAVLQALSDEGVDLGALVKIEVVEEV